MNAQLEAFNGICKRHDQNPNPNVIIGATVSCYKLTCRDFNSRTVSIPANYGVCDSKYSRDVKVFVLYNESKELADRIFHYTSKLSDEWIQQAWAPVFCQQQKPFHSSVRVKPELVIGFWGIIYDHFDHLLSEWLENVQKDPTFAQDKRVFKLTNGGLHKFWIKVIEGLLGAISRMYSRRLLHKALDSLTSYLTIRKHVKLINIRDSYDGKSEYDLFGFIQDDLLAFRDMLKKLLVPSLGVWPDRDAFLDFFDLCITVDLRRKENYEEFLNRLLGHPFIRSPKERMESFSELQHMVTARSSRRSFYINRNKEFDSFKLWNSDQKAWPQFLKDIYKFKKTHYQGDPVNLLRFLRNVHQHYGGYGPTIEDVDGWVRKLFPGFLETLHVWVF